MTDEERRLLLETGVGVSQVRRKILADRIATDNLRCFLTTLGWIVNYDFDAVDWDAVGAELSDTSLESNEWFEYELVGTHSARIKMARDGEEQVALEVNVPVELVQQIRLAIEIFGAFKVSFREANH